LPSLDKDALSKYVRTDCKRQLRLYLAKSDERGPQGMPEPQDPRPGIAEVTKAGHEWQAEKVTDLENVFGKTAVVSKPRVTPSGVRFDPIPLDATLRQTIAGGIFIVEGEFTVGPAFEHALGIVTHRAQFNLEYAGLRPDLLEVASPGTFSEIIDAAGEVYEVTTGDERLQLRVMDIKLTSEPSASYQLEVSYYSMVLAGWLIDQGLDERFVVARDCAVWPGSHEASKLVQSLLEWQNQHHHPTYQEMLDALSEDLEVVPFEVFALRLKRILQETVPEVLRTPWQQLDWHVDNRCRICNFLGAPWLRRDANGQLVPTWDDKHCRPEAEQSGHLSRVPFVSRGASSALRQAGVADLTALMARQPADPVFNEHQSLRATRTVIPERARAIANSGVAQIAPQSGTSAVMPRWADLRIYLSADFDPSSAITFAFGLKAFWIEPQPFGVTIQNRRNKSWPADTLVVDRRDLADERRELLSFLKKIQDILDEAYQLDSSTTVQFYLWDQLEEKHLGRVIGRHLPAILAAPGSLKNLAWLFPPEDVLPNPEQVTRQSPITIIRDVVRAVLAAPVAHYYTLLDIARGYHDPNLQPPLSNFGVHPLFEDYLGDQIPAERAHEIWGRLANPNWSARVTDLRRAVATRLGALEEVTKRLSTDLRQHLFQTAPPINITPPRWLSGVSLDGQLWYTFAKLNASLNGLEVHRIRAMPPHEREARFHSARLEKRLHEAHESQALIDLGVPLSRRQGARVYLMREASTEVKLRDSDFTVAISPEAETGFLDKSAYGFLDGTPLHSLLRPWTKTVDQLTQVTILAIDRDKRWIAVEPSSSYPTMLDDLEKHGLADFSSNAILDRTDADFFTGRLRDTLKKIANPRVATRNPALTMGTWSGAPRNPRITDHKPPADVLWDGAAMQQTSVSRGSLPAIKMKLEATLGTSLNASQWVAWELALSRRLQLIWGPPGTGKSTTTCSVIAGAVLAADQENRPLRVLVTASTYTAIDNVLLPVMNDLQTLVPSAKVVRVRSKSRQAPEGGCAAIDTPLDHHNPSTEIRALRDGLKTSDGITVVGSTPQQVHNLLVTGGELPVQEFFDLIVVDEATQVSVAESILALAGLAEHGAVVVAGDHNQLPPIRAAEPPIGLDSFVGSFYEYLRDIQKVTEAALDINYRSNETVVSFARRARYRAALTSHSPDLRLNLVAAQGQPASWPVELVWTPEWEALLDPDAPTVVFIHPDARSSQWNQFEGEVVTSLVTLLRDRALDRLENERDVNGNIIPTDNASLCADEDFWNRRVGIVTPHRAQQSLVIKRLQTTLGGDPTKNALIRDAVDTVERFQGQQRDTIIVSFALGDPDAIGEEEEFLLSFRRFNVMASRARAKLIVLISREIVDYLARDNDVLKDSALLKTYAQSFCDQSRPMTLHYTRAGQVLPVDGEYRFRKA
jgi:DNA replication ATP-dependent helicase Dna2